MKMFLQGGNIYFLDYIFFEIYIFFFLSDFKLAKFAKKIDKKSANILDIH